MIALFVILSLSSGCNCRQLGCIVCHKHISVDTINNKAEGLKTVTWHKSIGKGMHGNYKHIYVVREVNPAGKLVALTKESFITTYKDFGKIKLKKESIVYNAKNNSVIKSIEIYRKGKLSRTILTAK